MQSGGQDLLPAKGGRLPGPPVPLRCVHMGTPHTDAPLRQCCPSEHGHLPPPPRGPDAQRRACLEEGPSGTRRGCLLRQGLCLSTHTDPTPQTRAPFLASREGHLPGTCPLLAQGAGWVQWGRGGRDRGRGLVPVTESSLLPEGDLPVARWPVPAARRPVPAPWAWVWLRRGRSASPAAAEPVRTPSSTDDSGTVGVHYRAHELWEVI